MARVTSLHDAITRGGYQLAALIVILIAGSYCYEVAARYFFNSPTDWANALSLICSAPSSSWQCQNRRAAAPIAITILVDRRADPARRHLWRSLLAAVSAASCFAVFWISASETWVQFRDGVLTVATYEIPKWWISIFIAYGLLSSALYFLREALDPRIRRHRRRWSRNDMVASDRRRRSAAAAPVRRWTAGFRLLPDSQSDRLAGADRHSRLRHVRQQYVHDGDQRHARGCAALHPHGRDHVPLGRDEDPVDSLDRLVGQIRGRQFVLCILLSAILGALSGAAMAVAGLLGRSLFPTMVQRGYDRRLSAGTIMAGACLDPIIPPSVLAVIIATIANVSPASMLIAGILPGLLLMGMFLIYVVGRVWLDPRLAPDSVVDIADRNREGTKTAAVLRLVPCLFVFFMVMGLIMLGVATPTEAAATGVFGALIVSIYYGGLSRLMIWESTIPRQPSPACYL